MKVFLPLNKVGLASLSSFSWEQQNVEHHASTWAAENFLWQTKPTNLDGAVSLLSRQELGLDRTKRGREFKNCDLRPSSMKLELGKQLVLSCQVELGVTKPPFHHTCNQTITISIPPQLTSASGTNRVLQPPFGICARRGT